jgi:hypothetical protein
MLFIFRNNCVETIVILIYEITVEVQKALHRQPFLVKELVAIDEFLEKIVSTKIIPIFGVKIICVKIKNEPLLLEYLCVFRESNVQRT